MQQLAEFVLPRAKLWEYFVVDVATHVQEFGNALRGRTLASKSSSAKHTADQSALSDGHAHDAEVLKSSGLYSTGSGDRFHNCVKLECALSLFGPLSTPINDEEILVRCKNYENVLNVLNVDLYKLYDESIDIAMQNMKERVRYEFVSFHGPRWGVVSSHHPLLTSLFTRVTVAGKMVPLANNGWIYNGNPMIDFAGPHSNAYFERSVIVWGDCVKLRYGSGPSDSPWLWQHMANYTIKMAEIFHGFRIDNCHSTPIHVAQYLLDAARSVRKNLYVTCELFTGSEEIDALYVSQLGITSLIREAMAANDSWELGRLCHRHGGSPVGSFSPPSPVSIRPCLPGALFMDCTHDNETPAQKRTPEDSLPNSAIVSMAVSAVGSVRGYDELINKTIDVVRETRQYPVKEFTDPSAGIAPVKNLLNALHQKLASDGYNEIHVHQEGNIIAIQRHCPATHEAIYVISHTAFSRDESHWHSVRIPGKISEFLFAASLSNAHVSPHKSEDKFLRGLDANLYFVQGSKAHEIVHVSRNDSEILEELHFINFPPGSILGLKAVLPDHSRAALQNLHVILNGTGLTNALAGLSCVDLNVLLYRAGVEELVSTGDGAYRLRNYGDLVYCGLQGFSSVLSSIQNNNDLGHPMCNNLREGDWMMDYIVSRLHQRGALKPIASWLNSCFGLIKQLPRYLIPKYFSLVVMKATKSAEQLAIHNMSHFVSTGSDFIQALALTSIQLYGIVDSVLISNDAVLPRVPDNSATLAAGLTHFATGYMRSWGRDTFIALKGLFLVTGRFTEARYAACVRHGLVPNLLDSGVRPRYNARDAVWWFLQAIQDYCKMAPEGAAFLSTQVTRLFGGDTRGITTCSLAELIQEIMQKHATGIKFREWEAGTAIDDRMQDGGFNIDIRLNTKDGFIYDLRNHTYNCGTWMDKMGESSRAGNRGVPATPRVGAPIEITGLLKSTLHWLAELNRANSALFPFVGVTLPNSTELSYSNWDALVLKNFELLYFIPENPDDDQKYNVTSSLVNRRGIYRDVIGSSQAWAEYQLRPNQCIAMTVAPELFSRQHANVALKMVEDVLITGAPLGVRTLDPSDSQYCGDYINNDTGDYKTAGGFNYHNGPEWVWPLGYFLEAKMHFYSRPQQGAGEPMGHMVHKFLRHHRVAIQTSHFRGLPELTNTAGSHCPGSCEAQAWSSAVILSALHHLHKLHQHSVQTI